MQSSDFEQNETKRKLNTLLSAVRMNGRVKDVLHQWRALGGGGAVAPPQYFLNKIFLEILFIKKVETQGQSTILIRFVFGIPNFLMLVNSTNIHTNRKLSYKYY